MNTHANLYLALASSTKFALLLALVGVAALVILGLDLVTVEARFRIIRG